LAVNASLSHPADVAVDSVGNIYISDAGNVRVRLVTAATGEITTVAGTGPAAYGDPTFAGDGGLATNAVFNSLTGIALDAAGNLYIADYGNHRIRRVSADTGVVSTVAGNGSIINLECDLGGSMRIPADRDRAFRRSVTGDSGKS
jgi:trimeric autotransporter adhesin